MYSFNHFSLIGQKKGVPIENRIIVKNMSNAIQKIIPNCPDITMIKHISDNKFSYTDNTGITHHYLVYKSYNAYKTGISNIPHRLLKSNSFFIAETK